MPKPLAANASSPFVRALPPFIALGLLAGCSSVEGWLPHGDPNTIAIAQGANPPKTAQPAANPSEKPVMRPVTSADINCPPVEVGEDRSAFRVGGTENASVRYQFNISDTARQCDPAGPGQASIKIGVAGEVVIGPAGSAGTYSVPLRITVVREDDKKPVFSRTYKIEATTDGMSAGAFRLVTDPILVPMPTLQLADIYSISVGFEGGAGAVAPRRHRHGASG